MLTTTLANQRGFIRKQQLLEDTSEESGADQVQQAEIEEQRSKIKSAYLDTCEEVLGSKHRVPQ